MLRLPTPPAPLPVDDSAGAWIAFGDAQTGQLEQANAAKAAINEIRDTCEARYQALVKATNKKPWWKIGG